MNRWIKRGLPVLVAALSLAAFLAFLFYRSKPVTVRIMGGTSAETQMTVLDSGKVGKTVMVIGGIHGDETSGWKAADQLSKISSLKSGTLLILSPANAPGCREEVRNVEQYRDLNRSFPGDKDRDLTDQLAAAIFKTVEDYKPDIVVDLHEAYREEGNRDFLGNSLIFTDITGIEDVISGIISETQDGTLCSKPFSYYGPAPKGSLNREVSDRLGIPAITMEVSQEDSLEERISNHMELTHWIMRYYFLE